MRVILALTLAVAAAGVPGLSPETLKAYDRYVALTEKRIASERDGGSPLFWVDRQPDKTRTAAMQKLRRGEVIVEPLETRDGGREIDVPNGRIHHWVATTVIPGVTIDTVIGTIRQYDRYPTIFTPLMTRARVLDRQGDRDVVLLRTSIKKIVNVVMQGDYVMQYMRLSPTRAATTTVATNLQQVMNEGRSDERLVPTDQTDGYLWRYRMYCSIELRPEGALDQCESVTLTRTVPGLVSWLIGGTVAAIPRDSLTLMLAGTKTALGK